MEIPRLDPYLVRWSSDSVIAFAAELAGLQFLTPDAAALLENGTIKWVRTKAPGNLPKGRILDMQWSSALTGSNAGCLLACVFDTGVVAIVENADNEAKLVYTIEGASHSAVTWLGKQLILGDTSGELYGYVDARQVFRTTVGGESRLPITHLAVSSWDGSTEIIAAVLSDNSGWTSRDRVTWELVTSPSRFNVISAEIWKNNGELMTFRCGKLYQNNQQISMSTYLPGYIVGSNRADGPKVVHTDGTISDIHSHSHTLTMPQIQGDVISAQLHPNLPMGLVVLNTGSGSNYKGSANTWKFPILSSQTATIFLFPLSGDLPLPERSHREATSDWLSYAVHSRTPTLPESSPGPIDNESLMRQIDKSQTLVEQLKGIFNSEVFDTMRLRWFLSEANQREEVVQVMRAYIAKLISEFPAQSPIDKLVMSLYNRLQNPRNPDGGEFTLEGDHIEDTFTLVDQENQMTAISTAKRIWKRCALTLLPILSLDCRQSRDNTFAVYRSAPTILNGAESTSNPLADALLLAGDYCIYNGVLWNE